MSDIFDEYPYCLVKDLDKERRYHLILVQEIERTLMELSKKHGIIITLDSWSGLITQFSILNFPTYKRVKKEDYHKYGKPVFKIR